MTKEQLTYLIRKVVAEEIRSELPNAIAEAFQHLMESRSSTPEKIKSRSYTPAPVEVPQETQLKHSLRELFAGTNVMPEKPPTPTIKSFTKDPLLNEVLNQTRPFSSQERMGAPAGAAAMMAAVQAGVPLPGSSPSVPSMAEAMENPDFLNSMPDIGHIASKSPMAPPITTMAPPVTQASLFQDSHAPMANLPEGVSALDLAKHAGGNDPVTKALTKNYSGFLKKVNKAADQRKGVI